MVSAAGTSKKPNEIQNKTRRKTEYFIKEFACNAGSFFCGVTFIPEDVSQQLIDTYVNIDITERSKRYDNYQN